MLASDWLMLAVWPPQGPLSTAHEGDAVVWKLGVVIASWLLLAVVAGRTDLDLDASTPLPGRVIDERYRRRPRP
jgi:hypothetical protein